MVIGVSSVSLEGFRNYSQLFLELNAGFNVLTGPNAQGKTNFLESLYLLSTTRLLRGQRDVEAIREGSSKATVSAQTFQFDSRLTVVLERGIRKRALLNGVSLPRAADLIGRLPTVCISTADLEIVRGDPAERRMFLDLELSSLSPGYLRHLSLYKRALEQRNALLRESKEHMQPPATFEPWETQLAHHGTGMRTARLEYVGRLQVPTAKSHSLMGDGEEIGLEYLVRDEASTEEELLEALSKSRHHDVCRGGTSVGPHRDDLSIDVGGRDARLYGSQGQQRTAVISLKLATLEVAREELGAPSLLLLDDILSDLDEHRRRRLVDIVADRAAQAVLTCTEASAAGERILDVARVFSVRAGEVTQE